MAERRFRCHRRNLDGELAQVIRADENIQIDKQLNLEAMDNLPMFKTFESNHAPQPKGISEYKTVETPI
jgi:hypothetical protein